MSTKNISAPPIAIWEDFRKIANRELPQLQKRMDKNFGLTEQGFKDLLYGLQNGDDILFEQVFLTHFNDCRIFLMRKYKASAENAYDVTMDTLLLFYNGLKSGKIVYGNLRFLFTQMAGQVYLKWIKKDHLVELPEYLDIEDDTEQFDETTLIILNKAMENLETEEQSLLKAFYYEGISLKNIAQQWNKNPAAVRKQKQRCVEKLRALFIKFS